MGWPPPPVASSGGALSHRQPVTLSDRPVTECCVFRGSRDSLTGRTANSDATPRWAPPGQRLLTSAPRADEEGIAVLYAHPSGVAFETFPEQALSAVRTTRIRWPLPEPPFDFGAREGSAGCSPFAHLCGFLRVPDPPSLALEPDQKRSFGIGAASSANQLLRSRWLFSDSRTAVSAEVFPAS